MTSLPRRVGPTAAILPTTSPFLSIPPSPSYASSASTPLLPPYPPPPRYPPLPQLTAPAPASSRSQAGTIPSQNVTLQLLGFCAASVVLTFVSICFAAYFQMQQNRRRQLIDAARRARDERDQSGTGLPADVYSNLPRILVPHVGTFASDRVCAICLVDYQADESVVALPCKHNFHGECVQQWFQLHSTCPTCRHSLLLPTTSDTTQNEETVPEQHRHGQSDSDHVETIVETGASIGTGLGEHGQDPPCLSELGDDNKSIQDAQMVALHLDKEARANHAPSNVEDIAGGDIASTSSQGQSADTLR